MLTRRPAIAPQSQPQEHRKGNNRRVYLQRAAATGLPARSVIEHRCQGTWLPGLSGDSRRSRIRHRQADRTG
jgi:hypothetical protein